MLIVAGMWIDRAVRAVMLACVLVAPAGVAAEDAPAPAPEPLYASPTKVDRVGRILAAVEINGQGPFRFILDTGANSSALAPHLAQALALPASEEGVLGVHGVTGSAMLPAVRIESLRVGDIELREVTLPVLTNAVFAGADGILGVEGLQGARVDVDFTRDRVEISESDGRRATGGFLTVPARLVKDGLLMVDGRVGRIRVKVVIDTGAERTLGNLALRSAIEHRVDRREHTTTTVVGVTPEVLTATSFVAPTIALGKARLRNLPVAFDDLPVFELWGLSDEPALLVGMDLLGTLQQFVVDYPRREFQLRTRPAQMKPGFRRCAPYECATRIPSDGG